MKDTQQLIARIRHYSREMVRELGMLSEGFLPGLPPSYCHVLIELSNHGALNHIDLTALLQLDKSTISRIIKKLIDKKLVTISQHTDDQRYKPIMLTPAGKKTVEKIDERSVILVQGALKQLSPENQQTVLKGIELYEKALKRARIQNQFNIRPIKKTDNTQIMLLLKKMSDEYGINRGLALMDDELQNIYKTFSKEKSAYLVVEKIDNKKLVAGGGFTHHTKSDEAICEIRKMYCLPEYRGIGLGKTLLQQLLDTAKSHKYKQCYLETLTTMDRANHLYQEFDFKMLSKPLNTAKLGQCNRWYIKDL